MGGRPPGGGGSSGSSSATASRSFRASSSQILPVRIVIDPVCGVVRAEEPPRGLEFVRV